MKENQEEQASLIKRILKRSIVVLACFTVVYIMGGIIGSAVGIHYRTMFNIISQILIAFILPLFLIIYFFVKRYKNPNAKRWKTIVVTIVFLCIFGFWTIIAMFFVAMGAHEENRVLDNLIITDEGFMDPYYACYEPKFFILKKSCNITEDMGRTYLEEKYEGEFKVVSIYSSEIDFLYYNVFVNEDYPDMPFLVFQNGMELDDYYARILTTKYAIQGFEELGIDRNYCLTDYGEEINKKISITIDDKSDIKEASEDISNLLAYITNQTSFFDKQEGKISVLFQDKDKTASIPYGGEVSKNNGNEKMYFTAEYIEGELEREYSSLKFPQKMIVDSENNNEFEDNDEINILEEEIKLIYTEELKEDGKQAEIKYDAKDNLYLTFGSREAGEEEDSFGEGRYEFSLVYDRESKNGTCDLFVLYETHYSEEGTNDSQIILDVYAIEKETKTIVASGKQSWDDVGTKEYREISGE